MVPTATTDIATRRVYVVDDDSMIRRSLSFALGTAGFAVRPFASGNDFIDELSALPLGCVLLDLRMPGMDGFALLDLLHNSHCDLPVIVMTGHGDVVTAVRAMKAGARDFIEKPFDDAALRDMLEQTFEHLADGVPSANIRAQARARLAALTPREFDVLRALAGGLPNKVIADRLTLSVRTVEMHRANMMDRLGLTSLADLLRLAFTADVEPMK
ncbi:response regulator transcription factor [Sphingomonas sp. LT1P40]|uniref:response regulator transcription factor n=1 Tax=Alteristakelama amylovorans TaxID=3096166 RepID=UPI002FCBC254